MNQNLSPFPYNKFIHVWLHSLTTNLFMCDSIPYNKFIHVWLHSLTTNLFMCDSIPLQQLYSCVTPFPYNKFIHVWLAKHSYSKRAKTSQQDLPPLSPSGPFIKSSLYHKRNSCPEVTATGWSENLVSTSSVDWPSNPGIKDQPDDKLNCFGGKRTVFPAVVMVTPVYAPRPG